MRFVLAAVNMLMTSRNIAARCLIGGNNAKGIVYGRSCRARGLSALPVFMIVSLTLLAAGWLAVASTRLPADSKPASLTYVNHSGIHTLDPARMSWTTDFRVALNLWEGLTSWDPGTLEPIAGAAHFPPSVSEDGKRVTFVLRDDARWSNGDPVLARDFVRGIRRGLEPGTAGDYTFLLTDQIVGAGAYHQRRLEEVGVLTALVRLRDGWGLTPSQAQALARANILELEKCCSSVEARNEASRAQNATAAWETYARDLQERVGQSGAIDVARLHRTRLAAHAREADMLFADVGVRAADRRTLTIELRAPCAYFMDMTGFPIFLPCHESIERFRQDEDGCGLTETGLVVYDPAWTKPRGNPGADHSGMIRSGANRSGANGSGTNGSGTSRARATGGEDTYQGLITNGAYRLSSWTFKRRLRLEANPHYHGRAGVTCPIVDMLVFDHLNAALMAYDAGSVDLLPDLGVAFEHELIRLAESGERPDIRLVPLHATYFLNFNCLTTHEGRANPFADPLVRRAFTMAIDRATLVNDVLAKGDVVAGSVVPPSMNPNYPAPGGLSFDPGAAQMALEAAGYPGGDAFPVVEFLYTPNDELGCQAIASMWERHLGVRVRLLGMESKTFAQRKANHRYMVARGNWFADYRDPTTFLDCYRRASGNNDSGYDGLRFETLMNDARVEVDPVRRFAILAEAERIIVEDDCPVLPLWHYRMPIAVKPHVRGIHPNARLWFPFQHVDTGGG